MTNPNNYSPNPKVINPILLPTTSFQYFLELENIFQKMEEITLSFNNNCSRYYYDNNFICKYDNKDLILSIPVKMYHNHIINHNYIEEGKYTNLVKNMFSQFFNKNVNSAILLR